MQQIIQGKLGLASLGLFTAILCLVPVSGIAQGVASIWTLNAPTRMVQEYRVRFGDETVGNETAMCAQIPLPNDLPTPVGFGIAGPPDIPVTTSIEAGLCEEPMQPTGRLFVADESGTIVAIDAATPMSSMVLPLADSSSINALAYSGDSLYSLNLNTSPPTVRKIDPETGLSSDSCSMVELAGLATFEVKPVLAGGGGQLFTVVTEAGRQRIVALNTTFDIPPSTCQGEHFPAFDELIVEEPIVGLAFNGRRLFIATDRGTVYEGDASTGLSLRDATTAATIPPQMFQIAAASPTVIASQVVSSVFTVDLETKFIVELDTASNVIIQKSIPIPADSLDKVRLAYSGRSLFIINNRAPSRVHELSLTTGQPLIDPFNGPLAPSGIDALAFSNGLLYSLDIVDGSITKINPKTSEVIENEGSPCNTGLGAEGGLAAGRQIGESQALFVSLASESVLEIDRDNCNRAFGADFPIKNEVGVEQTIAGLAFNGRHLFAATTAKKIFAYRLNLDMTTWSSANVSFPDGGFVFSPSGLTSTRLDEALPSTVNP